MKNNLLYIACCVSLLFISFVSSAQKSISIQVNEASIIQPGISDDEVNEVIGLLEKTLLKYAETASLLDPNENRITSESMEEFNALFSPQAKVMVDYAEVIPRELVLYRDYAIRAYNNLTNEGIRFILNSAELVELSKINLGDNQFYTPILKVNRSIFNTLDNDGVLKNSISGIQQDQLFKFDIFTEDLTEATITGIEHASIFTASDDYKSTFVLNVDAGIMNYNGQFSDYWNSDHTESVLNLESDLSYSIGVEYQSDKFITPANSSSRKLGWSIGLKYYYQGFNTSFDSFNTQEFQDSICVSSSAFVNERFINNNQLEEKFEIGQIGLPIGIDYTFSKSRDRWYTVGLKFIPMFTLAKSALLQGDIFHDSYIEVLDLTMSDPNAARQNADFLLNNCAGLRSDVNQDLSSTVLQFQYAFEIAPTAYFKFDRENPGWGWMIGLVGRIQPNSIIEHKAISSVDQEALKVDSELFGSLSGYTNNLTSTFFGIKVGLFRSSTKEP